MARPSKTDDPRRSILNAARSMVVADGHGDLSLRAVAAKAGFSPASIYEYFDSRDDLLAAVAQEGMERLRLALAQALEKSKRPADALEHLGLAYVQFAQEHPEDFLLLFARLRSKRRNLNQPSGSVYGIVCTACHAALKDAGARATSLQVERAAYGLWAAAHGMAMLQLTHLQGFQANFKAADRQALRALIQGLNLRQ